MSEPKGESGRDAREIKVTDKRMFTAEGELKEQYRDLGERAAEERAEETAAAAEAPPAPGGGEGASAGPTVAGPASGGPASAGPAAPGPPPPAAGAGAAGGPGGPAGEAGGRAGEAGGRAGEAGGRGRVEIPGTSPGPAPTFYDLLSVLAEPVALYLGDAQLPDGSSAENLEAARLYIDLLDVLRDKTAGNLTAQETSVLEDVLYQLRMRYVQKRG